MACAWAYALGLALACISCSAFPAEVVGNLSVEGNGAVDLSRHLNGYTHNELRLEHLANEEAVSTDEDYDEGEDEDEHEISSNDHINAAPPFETVTKGLPIEGVTKNVVLSDGSNGIASYDVEVNHYNNMKQVRVVGPYISDVISLGPNADTNAIATDEALIVGSSIYSDSPGRLFVFNGQNCELRTYAQGTPVAQALTTDQCTRLRTKMERDRLVIAASVSSSGQNIAQNTQSGLQTATNSQAQLTYPGQLPFLQTASLNGQTVDVFGQTVSPTQVVNALGQTQTPVGQVSYTLGQTLTPTGQTNFGLTLTSNGETTNGLNWTPTAQAANNFLTPVAQTSNILSQALTPTSQTTGVTSTTNGQTINPFGLNLLTASGQTATNTLGQTYPAGTVVYPNGLIVTQTNPFGQIYSNVVGQTLPIGSTQDATQFQNLPFTQYGSALANWPFASNSLLLGSSSFLGGGISPFGPGGEPFERRPGPRRGGPGRRPGQRGRF